MVFNPERVIERAGYAPELGRYAFAFGFGRRRCPGEGLADANVLMATATSLSIFYIAMAKDQNGTEIVSNIDFLSGTTWYASDIICTARD